MIACCLSAILRVKNRRKLGVPNENWNRAQQEKNL